MPVFSKLAKACWIWNDEKKGFMRTLFVFEILLIPFAALFFDWSMTIGVFMIGGTSSVPLWVVFSFMSAGMGAFLVFMIMIFMSLLKGGIP